MNWPGKKKYKTLYEYAQSDEYPVVQILDVAKIASSGDKSKVSSYMKIHIR
jgi:hypothetical protein